MKLPAVGTSQHTFARSPAATISRSMFDRSHGHKTTWGNVSSVPNSIVPVYIDEMVPGDQFAMKVSAFLRVIPTVVPIMDNLYFDFFFFAVPLRLLWSHWYKFNGAQDNPGDSTSYVMPVITTSTLATGFAQGSIYDHMGLPIGVNWTTVAPNITSLPFRGYQLIWDQWFRDQNLQNSTLPSTGDGPDLASTYALLPRGLRHDYFTSCLPLPQKAPAVGIPLGGVVPVYAGLSSGGNSDPLKFSSNASVTGGPHLLTANSGNTSVAWDGSWTGSGPGSALLSGFTAVGGAPGTTIGYAPLSSVVSPATINQLRQSVQLQKLYERDNRGGTRYTEIIKAHFGVTSPDARQQRPEFLGGGSVPVIMSPVPQTSVTAATPQGNLAAYGTAAATGSIGFTYAATEHCYVYGLVAARADLTYQQGIDRMWQRQTRFDFYWPALAHIGEQGVTNSEIYSNGSSQDTAVFGYQERYGEYRFKPSKVTSEFNSNAATPLDYWHLAHNYTSQPSLNSTFISQGPPISRIVAVTSTDPFLADLWFDLKCARPMPVYSIPGMMDHF